VVAGVDSGEITAGSFLHDDGRTAVLVVNREYRQPARFSVQRSDTAPQVFDPKTRSWSNATDQIELPPGEGRLLR
jgi:hypothetical protein